MIKITKWYGGPITEIRFNKEKMTKLKCSFRLLGRN